MTEQAQRVFDALRKRPDILYEILRENRDLNIASPWRRQGDTRWNRVNLHGVPVALIDPRIEHTNYWWVDIGHNPSGHTNTLKEARDAADEALEQLGWVLG